MRSALGSRARRWRSSLRRPGCARWRRPICSRGSATGSSSQAARVTQRPGTAPYAPRSTGASTCWRRASATSCSHCRLRRQLRPPSLRCRPRRTVARGARRARLASLIQATNGRYRLLESVRDYVVERVGDDQESWLRHATYFTELAEAAEANLSGPEQGRWLERLDHEHDNLRAALDRLSGLNDRRPELRSAAALGRFWFLRGQIAEGLERLSRALETRRRARRSLSAKASRVRSALAVIRGDYPLAAELAESASRSTASRRTTRASLPDQQPWRDPAPQGASDERLDLDECIRGCAALGERRLLALAETTAAMARSPGELALRQFTSSGTLGHARSCRHAEPPAPSITPAPSRSRVQSSTRQAPASPRASTWHGRWANPKTSPGA